MKLFAINFLTIFNNQNRVLRTEESPPSIASIGSVASATTAGAARGLDYGSFSSPFSHSDHISLTNQVRRGIIISQPSTAIAVTIFFKLYKSHSFLKAYYPRRRS